MGNWRKFLALDAPERGIFAQAVLLLPLIEVGLRLFGLKRLRAFLGKCPRAGIFNGAESSKLPLARRLMELVNAAARHGLLRATCLRRALAGWWLLRCQGIESELQIGVRQADGKIYAHAWLKVAGESIDESSDLETHFSVFKDLL